MDPEIVRLIQITVWPIVSLIALLVVYKLAIKYLSYQERIATRNDVSIHVKTDTPNTEREKVAATPNKTLEEIMNEIWKPRSSWHWCLLSVLLFFVLGCGILTVFPGKTPTYLFAIAGFSIAYAIHFLAVSIGINGIILRIGGEPGDIQKQGIRDKIRDMREIEFRIVSAGMCVLAGGLLVLLSGGVFMITDSMWLTGLIYYPGAGFILVAILYYVRKQRGWPAKILIRLYTTDSYVCPIRGKNGCN